MVQPKCSSLKMNLFDLWGLLFKSCVFNRLRILSTCGLMQDDVWTRLGIRQPKFQRPRDQNGSSSRSVQVKVSFPLLFTSFQFYPRKIFSWSRENIPFHFPLLNSKASSCLQPLHQIADRIQSIRKTRLRRRLNILSLTCVRNLEIRSSMIWKLDSLTRSKHRSNQTVSTYWPSTDMRLESLVIWQAVS